MNRLTVYQRLLRAAEKGRGVRLSADEVWQLAMMDEAVNYRAIHDDAGIDPDGAPLAPQDTKPVTRDEEEK